MTTPNDTISLDDEVARAIARELGEEFDALPPGPHFDPEFTQDDFLRAAAMAIALLSRKSPDCALRAALTEIRDNPEMTGCEAMAIATRALSSGQPTELPR